MRWWCFSTGWLTWLVTWYSTCLRNRPFFSGMSSTSTVSSASRRSSVWATLSTSSSPCCCILLGALSAPAAPWAQTSATLSSTKPREVTSQAPPPPSEDKSEKTANCPDVWNSTVETLNRTFFVGRLLHVWLGLSRANVHEGVVRPFITSVRVDNLKVMCCDQFQNLFFNSAEVAGSESPRRPHLK